MVLCVRLSERVSSSLSCFLLWIKARAININSSLGLEIYMLIAFPLKSGRRPRFQIYSDEEIWEGENKDLDFTEL